MKYRLVILAVAAAVLVAAPLPAEEPPYFEFVQGLRTKHLPDLALEYLDELGKKKLPPDLANLLPLERAETRLDLAAEADEAARAALQAQARGEFEEFLRKNPNHPRAAEANLAIARMAGLEGKSQLSRARRQDNKDVRRSELLKARSRFEEAGKLLAAATAQIDQRLAGDAPAPAKQALGRTKLQADFDLGLNLLDQAQTYTEESEIPRRGEIVKQAIDVLTKVANQDPRNPLCWEARVYVGKCYQENDDPRTARKYYTEVRNEPGEHADAARRLARYFYLQVLARDPDPKKPAATLQQVQQQGESWLNDYRSYRNTPEGQGVRFEVANAYLQEAQLRLQTKTQQAQLQARELLTRAQKLFQELEQTQSEYADVARENKLNIILKLSADRTRGDISKLKDFEECYLRAQFEIALLNRAEKDQDGPKLEAARKDHLHNARAALERAFDLADAKVPAQDYADARYLQARTYFAMNDLFGAAVVGEDLARTAPQAVRSPAAATYALYAYLELLDNDERSSAPAEVVEADRTRLRTLAGYVEKTWPADPAADVARHQLGRLLLLEKKYPEAIDVLSRVSPTYADAARAFYQLAFAALQAEKADLKPAAGKPSYQDQALAALKKVPDPPAGADAGALVAYMDAKLTLGGILYRLRDYAQMEAIARALKDRLATLPPTSDAKARADLETKIAGLELLARYGRAEADYAAGKFAPVRDALEPVVKDLQDPAKAAKLAEIKDPGLLPALLGLAVRANVQDNKVDKAREILAALQKSSPDNYLEILRQLVRQLRLQVQDLRQKGEPAKAQLNQTVANFTAFLDQLAKQQEQIPQPDLMLFLAQSYSSLDNHQKAAELLALVPEPKPAAGHQADPKAVQIYRAARILAAREMRLDKQFDKARLLLDEVLGTAQRPGWGHDNLEAQKERIFLLEDQQLYGPAMLAWNALLKQLQPRVKLDAKVKDQYFECYYHLAYCQYRHGLKLPDEKKKLASVRRAATFIEQLERTQPDMGGEASKQRFEELLKAEPLLRQQYEDLKRASK